MISMQTKPRMVMLSEIKNDLASDLPNEVVDALLSSFEVMKRNYFLAKHEPSELSAGKFVEACIRVLQHETTLQHTPLGTTISNVIGKLRDFENLPPTVNEAFRIHIPRVLIAIYNIRNKRGVAHLGGEVNPNLADATFVMACADWVLAELFRIHYKCTLEHAQSIVDGLVQRPFALVHRQEGIKRVLSTTLSLKDQTLLLLASEYPSKVPVADLVLWIEPKDKASYLRRVLNTLHQDRLIEYKAGEFCVISPLGLNYVETRHSSWVQESMLGV